MSGDVREEQPFCPGGSCSICRTSDLPGAGAFGSPEGWCSNLGTRSLRPLVIACIRFYQRHISRWTPAVCRFTPTCSQYAVDAIEKYGALKGGWMAVARICRCHPLNKGGYDPVV